jgi:hypothetical protein
MMAFNFPDTPTINQVYPTPAVAATSDVFRITGVVVLPGIEAPSAARSPLIMRPYDQELLICQRYWQKSYDRNGVAGGNGYTGGLVGLATGVGLALPAGTLYGGLSFKTRMRSTPSILIYSYAGTVNRVSDFQGGVDMPASSGFVTNSGETSTILVNSGTTFTPGGGGVQFHYIADARL